MNHNALAVRQFFDVLWPLAFRGALTAANGGVEPFVTLSAADPKIKNGPLRSYHLQISDPELEIVAAHLDFEGFNTYVGLGAHGRDLGVHTRGKKSDVIALAGWWCDVDVHGPGHAAQNLPPSISDAAEVLVGVGIEPSAAVGTGGGCHFHWLFDRPLLITDANREAVGKASKAFQQRIVNLFKAVPAERGGPWHCDDTSDITRILRPVGTRNWKVGTDGTPIDGAPFPVEWLHPPEDCVRYSPEELGIGAAASLVGEPLRAFPAGASVPTSARPELSYDATRDAVLAKIARNRKPERSEILKAVLDGKSFAEPGARDHTLQRVASWLAWYCCDGDPEALTDLLIPSLAAMEEASPTDFISYEDAFTKVVRAQNDAREKERVRLASEARIMERVFGVARPRLGAAST